MGETTAAPVTLGGGPLEIPALIITIIVVCASLTGVVAGFGVASLSVLCVVYTALFGL